METRQNAAALGKPEDPPNGWKTSVPLNTKRPEVRYIQNKNKLGVISLQHNNKCGWGLGGVPVSEIKANPSRTGLPARCLSLFVGSLSGCCSVLSMERGGKGQVVCRVVEL